MSPKRLIGALGAASLVALVIGCSKSATAPNYPFAGTWQVVWGSPGYSLGVAPDTILLTLSGSGTVYTATYPDFKYWYINNEVLGLYTDTLVTSSVAVSGDSLKWRAADKDYPGCYAEIDGTIADTTMQGAAVVGGAPTSGIGSCQPGMWSWTARKQ